MYVGLHKDPVGSERPVVPSDFASVARQRTGVSKEDDASLDESRAGSPSRATTSLTAARSATTARSGRSGGAGM